MRVACLIGVPALATMAVFGYAGSARDPTCPNAEIQFTFLNLDFHEGKPGDRPPGWNPAEPGCYLPPHGAYVAAIASGASCYLGGQCGQLSSTRVDAIDTRWGLFQVVDAKAYRGKRFTLRAAVRADVRAGSDARLMLRVHRNDGSTSFFDNMGRFPFTSNNWSFYEIEAPIAQDARDMEFGLQLDGQGVAWIDNISVKFADTPR
jgi:hypothetical protein